MFETVDSAEAKMPSIFLPNGKRIWSNVSLSMHIQWFYVIYKTEYEDNTELQNVIFLTRDEQIVEMLSLEKCEILEVYLVSPNYINGSDCWKMEKIKEIWEAKLKNDVDTRGRIYVLEDGREYMHSYLTMNSEDFTKKELLIEIKNID